MAKVDRRTLQAGQRVGATEISEHVRLLYSCGKPMVGVDLRIVDTETAEPCEPGHVGEIWLSSECVTAGYYNKPQLNQEVFKVRAPFIQSPVVPLPFNLSPWLELTQQFWGCRHCVGVLSQWSACMSLPGGLL